MYMLRLPDNQPQLLNNELHSPVLVNSIATSSQPYPITRHDANVTTEKEAVLLHCYRHYEHILIAVSHIVVAFTMLHFLALFPCFLTVTS